MTGAARSLERIAAAAGAFALAFALLGCGNATPPAERKASPAPATPQTAPAAAPQGAPQAAPQAAESAAPRNRGDHRERRRSERAETAFAAGPIEIAEAQRTEAHGRLVEFDATVEKVLTPDRRGLPHQRFIVRVPGAGTVLIAHNTQLAGEVPLSAGERVRVRGLFEWNRRGGVVHWTHHDPAGGAGAGWIRAGGKTYQ